MLPLSDGSRLMLRTMQDLADLAALAADCVDDRPLTVAEDIADLLLTTLRLDFAYLRFQIGQADGHEMEVVRTTHQPTSQAQAKEIAKALACCLDHGRANEVQAVKNPLGSGIVHAVVVPIGRDGATGVMVAGSHQADFPGEEDRLLLNFAAQQAAIALKCRRAEQARRRLLRERDDLLARLQGQFERIPMACIVFNAQLEIIDWNPATEKMFGYTKAEALGRSAIDLILRQPIDHEVLEVYRRVETGDVNANNINENYTKDGCIITCNWFNTSLIDPDGNFAGGISVIQDITDRKRAEDDLRIMNAALENAVQGIARLDTQGRYLTVNRAFASILGYAPDELVGRDWLSTVHPKFLDEANSAYERMLSAGRAEVELLGVRKDDSVFWRQTVIVLARDHQPPWFGHYCFMNDITDRKRAEEVLSD
jgi:PAS domain S-box-containing protein